jgi:hypothetical protein
MTKEKRLKKEAMDSARRRGHTFSGKWEVLHPKKSFSRECCTCKKQVFIDLNPPPNGIDIGGEAVALNCSKE